MEETRTKICIYCKRVLEATIENFTEEKKGKNGVGNVCRKCQHERAFTNIYLLFLFGV